MAACSRPASPASRPPNRGRPRGLQNDFCHPKASQAQPPTNTANARRANRFAAKAAGVGAHVIDTRQVLDLDRLTRLAACAEAGSELHGRAEQVTALGHGLAGCQPDADSDCLIGLLHGDRPQIMRLAMRPCAARCPAAATALLGAPTKQKAVCRS